MDFVAFFQSNIVQILDSSFIGIRSSLIERSTFDGYHGSAIQANIGSIINITNCTFIHITSYSGTALFIQSFSTVTIHNCSFHNNRAEVEGGGTIFVALAPGIIEIIKCSFINNSAGAIIFYGVGYTDTRITINSCIFIANTLANKGGAISISQSSVASFSISDSTFENNSAFVGGAVFAMKYLFLIQYLATTLLKMVVLYLLRDL